MSGTPETTSRCKEEEEEEEEKQEEEEWYARNYVKM